MGICVESNQENGICSSAKDTQPHLDNINFHFHYDLMEVCSDKRAIGCI